MAAYMLYISSKGILKGSKLNRVPIEQEEFVEKSNDIWETSAIPTTVLTKYGITWSEADEFSKKLVEELSKVKLETQSLSLVGDV